MQTQRAQVAFLFLTLCIFYLCASLLILNTIWTPTATIEDSDNHEFSWSELTPSRDLQWKGCSPRRQCARLIVPLNHSDPTGAEAIIALIRLPASIPSDSESYSGPILFNPGGPGGSGVLFLQDRTADLLQKIVGPEFDLVSFDPRGVGESIPRASFFKSGVERILWNYGLGVVNNADEGIARTWARAHVMGQLAAENDDGYLKYINTEQTARDMLSIVEAHGQTQIQYWAFSYGTILGSTFASLFPDRIERMVLDGVVHAEEYYSLEGIKSLDDIDKTLNSFFGGCADAGPDGCAFWAPTGDEIRTNLTNLYKAIRSRPLPVKSEGNYGVFDYNLLRLAVFSSLYSPYLSFALLANELAQIASGDASASFDRLKGPEPYRCACNSSEDTAPSSEAQVAIMCNDAVHIPPDLKSSEKSFDSLVKSSSWADLWASIRLGCVHPILFIGNTADPVTPLAAAKKMSQGFPGSVVLTQNSAGHCSIAAPSLCTPTHIRRYFIDGTLPEPGTICEPIGKPFDKTIEPESRVDGQNVLSWVGSTPIEEQQILNAASELSKRLAIPHFIRFST